ncbi:PIN domain nuclease [Candidatus Bathyarchaeota archaeon CG07_land_8_20_14_0_80_47_9]|nr:MAG: PIN domain nuclease [Candidatus Bathyarchaeota archaeon CG07_land_8_20_14_0_80_47_9]
MKVIDSSALIKYVGKEENWEKVEEHLKEGCITLDLATKETANALVKKALKNEVTPETAKEIINYLPKIVRITPQKEHFSKAFEIAIKHKLTIYDALFIALSVNTNMPLLTSDEKQAKASKEHGVAVTLM